MNIDWYIVGNMALGLWAGGMALAATCYVIGVVDDRIKSGAWRW